MSLSSSPSSWKDIFVNVDLHALTPIYLDQLDAWKPIYDAVNALSPQATIDRLWRVIYRYEKLWLPLVADWKTSPDPEPPADVHWLWQVHLLRTKNYSDFCRAQFGKLLPHRLRPARASETCLAVQQTMAVWRQRYPAEPFDLPLGSLGTSDDATRSTLQQSPCQLTQVLTIAARRDVEFIHQVALPHMRDADFLYVSVERYRKMLLLRRQRLHEAATVRLPIDIQLVQRVHALHPVQFIDDMRRLFGGGIGGASSVPDCDPDCDISASDVERSNAVWRRLFHGETLFLSGTTSRGRVTPDGSVMGPFPRDLQAGRRVESCDVTFSSITVDELWSHSGIKKVVVEARLLGENSFSQNIIFRQSGTVGVPIGCTDSSSPGPSQSLGKTHFDAVLNRGIELVVEGRSGFACFGRKRNLSTKLFNPLQHCTQSTVSLTVTLPKVTYTDPKITIGFTVQAATPKPYVFTFDRNTASRKPVATELRPFVSAFKTWTGVMGSPDSLFLHARHGLKCRDGMLAFGVEVIKQDQSDLSAVLVYHNNQTLVAAAYSVDSDLLPNPCQVSETCPLSFDAPEDDNAMLIRNHEGDFAICVARRTQHPAPSGSDMETRISFKLYLVKSRQLCRFDVRDDEMQSIKVTTSDGSVEVDLPTGRLTVDAQVAPLAEYIALAFTVGILFVTIQKSSFQGTAADSYPSGSIRSTYSTPARGGSPVPSEASRFSASTAHRKAHQKQRKAANKRRKMSASFTFLLACGLQVDLALSSPINGGGSVGKASLGSVGRHGNGGKHVANGSAGYPQFHQSQPAASNSNHIDDKHFMDVRL